MKNNQMTPLALALVSLFCGAALHAQPAATEVKPPPPADSLVQAPVASQVQAVTPESQDMSGFLTELIKTDRRLSIARSELEAAELRVKSAWGDWFPDLSITMFSGDEKINYRSASGTNSSLDAKETDYKLTQLLWDFGKTNSKIRSSEFSRDMAGNSYITAEQTLLADATAAYINLFRSMSALELAYNAEKALFDQLTLEMKRQDAGAGVKTDVLQARAQLQGAQARRSRAQSQAQQAQARFMNIFGVLPQSLAAMKRPQSPGIPLPKTFDEAIETGLNNNPTMKGAKLSTFLATETKNQSTAGMLPKVEAIWDYKHKDDIAGTSGTKTEEIAKINVTWNFNLGLRDYYADAANAKAIVGSAAREVDAERNAKEEIGSAFRTLGLSRQTAEFLNKQVESAEQFLELARKEREMGKRSLLDVLSGEATLAGAKSDALSAEMDVLLATYNLLRAMGKLDVGSITAMK